MRNDFCTGYLAHSAKGKEWEKHKYVAKVKLASGKYFYFYSDEQYQKFLKKVKERSDAEREKVNEKFGKNKKEEVKKKETTTSSKKKKKGSGSSKKSSTSSKKGKTSTGSKSSSKKASAEKKEKTSTAKAKSEKKETTKKSSEKATKVTNSSATTTEVGVKKTAPTLSAYKYQYDLKDKDIDTYKGDTNNERVTANRVKEVIEDMIDKYPDNASGYIISSFSDNISYQFQWVKENGTIKLVDPDSGIEVSADAGLINSTQINLFRTDDKKKKQ